MNLNTLYAHCQGDIITLRPSSKVPQDPQWTVAPSPYPDVDAVNVALMLGHNVGYRIPPLALIVDVDPKNGGLESFKKLPASVQSLPATTQTPSGGYHIYTTLPTSVLASDLKTTVREEYPGIDFLHHGRQVVLPGSQLSSELVYHLNADALIPPPPTPPELITILTKERTSNTSTETDLTGLLSNGELVQALAELPVTRYQDNDSWLQIMMSCHHATGGEGLEAFLAWSLSDPMHSDQEEVIRTRWESASVEPTEAPRITIRTLCQQIGQHGPVPPWLRIKAGLAVDASTIFEAVQPDVVQAPVVKYQRMIEQEEDHYELHPKLSLMIASDGELLEVHREKFMLTIAKKIGASVTALRKDVKSLTSPKINAPTSTSLPLAPVGEAQPLDESQVHLRLTASLLDYLSRDCHGVTPLFSMGKWWLWNGRHWSDDIAQEDVKKRIQIVAQVHGSIVTNTLIKSVNELAITQATVPASVLSPDASLIRVYADNVAVNFNRYTFQWEAAGHNYMHKNRSVIQAEYRPDAEEPTTWLRFLSEATSSEQARRTLACAIIYAAGGSQPWLRKSFFFYGPKRSGKSTTLDLIESLLGQHNCSALNLTQLGGKNGPVSLVGKLANISNETISKKTFKDDIFKSIVSGESIMVEQKYERAFAYRNTAKMFMAANGFPRISDESEAVWDRLVLLSFPNSVPIEQADHNLSAKLFKERHSILNWAMQIFAEEYARDECRSAMEPDAAGRADIARWRRVNSPALSWVRERTTITDEPTDLLHIDQAYLDYTAWCSREGHHTAAKNRFATVVNRQLKKTSDERGRAVYVGVKLEDVVYFNDATIRN